MLTLLQICPITNGPSVECKERRTQALCQGDAYCVVRGEIGPQGPRARQKWAVLVQGKSERRKVSK